MNNLAADTAHENLTDGIASAPAHEGHAVGPFADLLFYDPGRIAKPGNLGDDICRNPVVQQQLLCIRQNHIR